ncbi:hypothetical protein DQ04_01731080 [Trypanosoma grayi]|uniref:hypothetical protein n=1 Tax=Trypanosoma grayi TaxID=71804 RepID=UPI0004F47CB4|nr:hypothetical protein DQ04_01731080 [Trypanosoma grayi]KEG12420.1 hypothetical protein DQ04_01731080 [Trypanosoma grayi]
MDTGDYLPTCLDAIRNCNDNATLLDSVVEVEFGLQTSIPDGGEDKADLGAAGHDNGSMRYELQTSLEPLMASVLTPAVFAVVDECLNAMVFVYGATQEMKQLGVVGTPEECGLLPQGICMVMNRCAERRSHECSNSSWSIEPTSPDLMSESTSRAGVPGSHRFVRAESTFVAFDANSVVDLVELDNDDVELAVHLGDPQQVQQRAEGGELHEGLKGMTPTDARVSNARAMPAEHASHALETLDIGLENFTRATEMGLLQSQAGTSLLFSLTLYTDDFHFATFHLLCLAEDASVQNWVVTSALARSQAVASEEELNSSIIQNVSLPQPLRHNAATMLLPLLCFGNIYTSVLVCAYNSVTAVQRLTRDLTFALAGIRMLTVPQATALASRHSQRPLSFDWEGSHTHDARHRYGDKTNRQSPWEESRDTHKENYGGSPGIHGVDPQDRSPQTPLSRHVIRVPLGDEDRLYLDENLYRACRGTSPRVETVSSNPPYSIVVVDTQAAKHVLLGPAALRAKVGNEGPTPAGAATGGVVSPSKKATEKSKRESPITPDVDDHDDKGGETAKGGHASAEVSLGRPGVYEVEELVTLIRCEKEVIRDEDYDDATGSGNGGGGGGENSGNSVVKKGGKGEKKMDAEPINVPADTKKFYTEVMHGDENKSATSSSPKGGAFAPEVSGACVRVTPEVEELDSLVEEFSRFYHEAYDAKKRIKQLEGEVIGLREALDKKKNIEEELRHERERTKLLGSQLVAARFNKRNAHR